MTKKLDCLMYFNKTLGYGCVKHVITKTSIHCRVLTNAILLMDLIYPFSHPSQFYLI